MAYLAPYWLLDPLTIMIREMHVVVVYQLALLRRSSMGTAGATITCSSILASIDAETTLSRSPQVLCRVRYQKSKPNLSTFLQKVLPPISEIEPNQISILYYIQHR